MYFYFAVSCASNVSCVLFSVFVAWSVGNESITKLLLISNLLFKLCCCTLNVVCALYVHFQ